MHDNIPGPVAGGDERLLAIRFLGGVQCGQQLDHLGHLRFDQLVHIAAHLLDVAVDLVRVESVFAELLQLDIKHGADQLASHHADALLSLLLAHQRVRAGTLGAKCGNAREYNQPRHETVM